MPKPHVVILGGGPAGLGAALQLTKHQVADVTVLEQRDTVGGNAGSFELDGLYLDYGSHRLHPACDPGILGDLQQLLGDDLLTRPRHGRISLKGRWVHFPLKPVDLALRLPPSFALGVAGDTLLNAVPRPRRRLMHETFASLLQNQLGKTICHEFYFPYARKIWGMAPEDLSHIQAERRVSANSVGKMLKKVLSTPAKRRSGMGRQFFYPRRGYGQISEAIGEAAAAQGARLLLGSRVQAVHCEANQARAVSYVSESSEHMVQADHVWSTIPITVLARCLSPKPTNELVAAADKTKYRAMILIYLVLDQDQFSEYDAHYFPGADIAITRLSEPKNYSDATEPIGRTALCAELPCDVADAYWQMSDEQLGKLVLDSLNHASIPVTVNVRQVLVRRLGHAYPIYQTGFEHHFMAMDRYVAKIDRLLTFGRQGLFAHDNTHHGLYMAYAAVDCLDKRGEFDSVKWQSYRDVFESHVVED